MKLDLTTTEIEMLCSALRIYRGELTDGDPRGSFLDSNTFTPLLMKLEGCDSVLNFAKKYPGEFKNIVEQSVNDAFDKDGE